MGYDMAEVEFQEVDTSHECVTRISDLDDDEGDESDEKEERGEEGKGKASASCCPNGGGREL